MCGLLPIITGTLVFIAWWITRDPALGAVGVATIVWGLALFFVGCVSLVIYIRKAQIARFENWRFKALVAGLILIANFPLAAGYIAVAIYLDSVHTVSVENLSANTIDRVTFIDPRNSRYEFGSVAVDEHREEQFHFGGEGTVTYEVSSDGVVQSNVLIGYISAGMGGCALLKIGMDGTARSTECL
jgi:hypothetical protein